MVYEPHFGIHTSGHAQQEELKLLLNLTKPKYFVPIHGEHRMLMKHAELAETVGVREHLYSRTWVVLEVQ